MAFLIIKAEMSQLALNGSNLFDNSEMRVARLIEPKEPLPSEIEMPAIFKICDPNLKPFTTFRKNIVKGFRQLSEKVFRFTNDRFYSPEDHNQDGTELN